MLTAAAVKWGMTPFGEKIRELRARKGVNMKQMAAALGVSPAYLSALEHGKRGRPGPGMTMQICGYFDLIWDETEEMKRLAAFSNPRPAVNTAGLSPRATALANLLAARISELDDQTLEWIIAEIEGRLAKHAGPVY